MVKIAPSVVDAGEPFTACFKFPASRYAEEYKSILGIDVKFDAPYNAFVGVSANTG